MSQRLNYISPLNSLGYGQVGRHLLRAMDGLGVEPALWPLGPVELESRDEDLVKQCLGRVGQYNPNAPCLKLWHAFGMHEFIGRGLHGGYTFFELDRMTKDEVHQLNSLDVVFVASEWARGVLHESGVTTARIAIAWPGVDTSIFHPQVRPTPLRKPSPNTTVFINVGKFSALKGHDFLLEAFNAAFTPADDVMLVMACFHPLRVAGFDGPAESKRWENTYMDSPLGRAGKIKVVPGRLKSQQEVASLMAAADCGVFLARGEGWNLELAEMLAMGKNAIHTECSAHTEFASRGGSLPVLVGDTEEAYDPPFIRPGVGNWAKLGADQLEAAVSHMRLMYSHKQTLQSACQVNQRGIDLFENTMTWGACAKDILKTLGV